MFQGRKPIKKVHLILNNYEDVFYLENKSNYLIGLLVYTSLCSFNNQKLANTSFCTELNSLCALLRMSAGCPQCLEPRGVRGDGAAL